MVDDSSLTVTPGGRRLRERAHEVTPGYPVSPDWVLTPGGYRPKSFTHEVAIGSRVLRKHGELYIEEVSSGALTLIKTDEAVLLPRFGAGWIVNVGWTNNAGSPITLFEAEWSVPAPPPSNNGQTVFLFNGIQDTAPSILQPVLQWGPSAAGTPPIGQWAVSNWYVTHEGHAFYTRLIAVAPSTLLKGMMSLVPGSNFEYVSSFDGYDNALTTASVPELIWCNETLEAYGITACSDYPPNSLANGYGVEFSNVEVTTGNGSANVQWTADKQVQDCGQDIVINGSVVDISFGHG